LGGRIKGGGGRRRREGREGRVSSSSFPFRFFSSLDDLLGGGLEFSAVAATAIVYLRRRKEKRGFKENF
jgi:hypothetical protein